MEDDKKKWLSEEALSREYHAAVGENPQDLKPNYDFSTTQEAIEKIDLKILKIKHALNVFNSTTEVGHTGLTIDQVLIRLPQLMQTKIKLYSMRDCPAKRRYGISGNVIDYIYTSYNPAEAATYYDTVCSYIDKLHLELDKVNMSVEFEVDI